MPLPESFIQHLRDYGYNSRSNKHSNALAAAIVEDLIRTCEPLAHEAKDGKLVYDLNMDLRFGTSTWNVDLVMGTPATVVDTAGAAIVKVTPATVRVAAEIKGVMTEHRKNVKNRKRDLEAHHEHVHNYSKQAVAAGVMVLNAAPSFASPLRAVQVPERESGAMARIVEHCVNEMRNVTQSGGVNTYGMDAKAVLVVEFDNVNLAAARYAEVPPAPRSGDPLHYDSFIQRLCQEYKTRFA